MIFGTHRQTRFFGGKPTEISTAESSRTYPDAHARATAKLFRRADAEIAVTEHEAVKQAQYANTERLRGLRLAKEAEFGTSKHSAKKRN